MKKILFAALFLAVASMAHAQAIPNPTKAEFEVSPDHTSTAIYEIGYYLNGAAEPVQVVTLGTFPAITAPGVASTSIDVKPLGFSRYTAKVRLKINNVYSEWSAPSNPFERVPLPPGNIVVSR